jgi:uncharacterized repeat protein (TIGR01451 family)
MLILAPSGIGQKLPNITNQPLTFEPNLGQSTPKVKYIASDRSHKILVSDSSFTYVINEGSPVPHAITLRWVGSAGVPTFVPKDLLPGISNYFVGNDQSRWVSQVPHYSQLKETGVRSGVDVRYHSDADGDLEYDLIVAPDTDLASFHLSIEGAEQVHLCDAGALCLEAGGVKLRQLAPQAYETRGGKKVVLAASYLLKNGKEVSFAIPGRTPGSQLIIDPIWQYATYLGGNNAIEVDEAGPDTWGQSVAIDAAGNFYVEGQTFTMDFPVTTGAYLTTCSLPACAYVTEYFVSKFSPSGKLIYSTYLAMNDYYDPNSWTNFQSSYFPLTGKSLAVDTLGNAYIAGDAFGGGIATTSNAYQPSCPDDCTFLAKLSPDGSKLLYSTYFGSSGTNIGGFGGTSVSGLAIGSNGDVYLAGTTTNPGLPTTVGAYQTVCQKATDGSCFNGYAARFNTNLSGRKSLVFSTYLGIATGLVEGEGIAVDNYGDAYIVGLTTADMPSIAVFGSGAGPQLIYWGKTGASIPAETFVLKLNGSNGAALRAATLLRGVSGTAIAVDSSLNTFVAGSATNLLATTQGAYQTRFGGGTEDGFVTKLDPSGYFLLFSTFLGGSADDSIFDIAVNNVGMPFVTGVTMSTDFPVGPGVFGLEGFGFVTALNADGRSIYYSSYLGGAGFASPSSIALDSAWDAYVVGRAYENFPVTPNAFQPTFEGFSDAFVAKIVIAGDLRAAVSPSVTSIAKNGVVVYHAQLTNLGPDEADKVVFTDAIPSGMSYAGVYVPNGNGCNEPKVGATSGTLICNKAVLSNGQTYYVNVYLRAVGKSGTKVANKVAVSAQTQDLWPANNSATTSITIK